MSSGPRTAVLAFRQFNAAVAVYVAQCPPLTTLIVKTITLYNGNTENVVANVTIQDPSLAATVFLTRSSMPTATVVILNGWWAMTPGQLLSISTSSSGITIHVSGTVLQGVANYEQLPQGAQQPIFPMEPPPA